MVTSLISTLILLSLNWLQPLYCSLTYQACAWGTLYLLFILQEHSSQNNYMGHSSSFRSFMPPSQWGLPTGSPIYNLFYLNIFFPHDYLINCILQIKQSKNKKAKESIHSIHTHLASTPFQILHIFSTQIKMEMVISMNEGDSKCYFQHLPIVYTSIFPKFPKEMGTHHHLLYLWIVKSYLNSWHLNTKLCTELNFLFNI